MRGILILAPLLIGILACSGADETSSGETPTATIPPQPSRTEPYRIVVSLPLFADFVREIGGDRVTVTALIPPGADPHTYVPTPDQAQLLTDAEIVFVNGLGLEKPTLEFIEANKPGGRLNVIPFAGNVPSPSVEQPLDKPIYATEVGDNPHLYLNAELGKIYPETVADSLFQLGHDEYFRNQFQSYYTELRNLDVEIREQLGAIPLDKRVMATHHDAFVHLASYYGFEVLGSLSDANNVAVPDLRALEELVRTKKPAAIFVEAGFDPASVQQLAERTGVAVCTMYSDILSDTVTTYFEMLRANADELVRCLS